MEDSIGADSRTQPAGDGKRSHLYVALLLIAAAIYLGCIVSPPSLMDDVDAEQAQTARNMVIWGDWVTAHINGLPFLEKPPLVYWTIAAAYKVFGAHDWAARIPIALSAIGLAWLTAAFGTWAFGKRAGFYAGLCLATCAGLFLFTRILIPDAMQAFTIALAMWAFLRALDEEERHPRLWTLVFGASLGTGLLLKSLIAVVFPAGAGLLYLLLTRQLFSASVWKRLHVVSAAAVAFLIAAPWHILATLRNPPYYAFTLHSGPGEYHGFLWFFFINEQLLRFLNMRYPHDYNTVPRLWFWLLHLVWLFPWSVYLPAVAKLSFKPTDRAGRTRLLALCWTGFILVFFTFSTTQEYYSMPCYPALALLLGSAMAVESNWIRGGTRALAVIGGLATVTIIAILWHVRGLPTPGDISVALSRHPKAYTLSLGHMLDLTLDSFAYLRLPLVMAGVAFLAGALGTVRAAPRTAYWAVALMMVLFFHAARRAMVAFDPFLSSRPLAQMLMHSPPGTLIAQGHYYEFSSVFFYTNRQGFLFTDRRVNLEYGSYAPGAPHVFLNETEFKSFWLRAGRCYLLAPKTSILQYESLVGGAQLYTVAESGGKLLLTNQPVAPSGPRSGQAIAPSN